MEESEQYDKICKPQLDRIEGYVQKIFQVIEGNGNPGLIEKIARHDERIKILQNWKRWAIGFGTTLLIALLIYALRKL